MPNTIGHTYLGLVMERKNHLEEHGLTTSSMPASNQHHQGQLRRTASTMKLRKNIERHSHNVAKPEKGHCHRAFTSLQLRPAASGAEESKNPSIVPSSEARSVDTAARHRDAVELFESYGISRPEGWLSEENPADALDFQPPDRKTQVCHACGNELRNAQRFCGSCGHEACLRCLGELSSSRSLCDHQHSCEPGVAHQHSHPQPRMHKTHRGHNSGRSHSQTYSSRSANPGSSTPRPRHLLVSSVAEEETFTQLKRKDSTKTGFEGSGLVKDNPFFRNDRSQRAGPTTAQISQTDIQAYRQTQNSDCVPHRDHGGPLHSYMAHSDCPKALHEHKTTDRQHSEASDRVKESTHAIRSTKANHPNGRRDFHAAHEESLEGKVDQLYHHAQDMHHSQHILEHLAAGARQMDEIKESPVPHPARSPPSTHLSTTAETALHSLIQDPQEQMIYLPGLHSMGIDDVSSVYRPPTHELDMDDRVDVNKDVSIHEIRDDHIAASSSSKIEGLSQETLSRVEGWRKFHGAPPDVSISDSDRLKPASPKSWMDRPARISRSPSQNQIRKNSKSASRRDQSAVLESLEGHLSSTEVQYPQAMESKHALSGQLQPESAPWPCVEEVKRAKESGTSPKKPESTRPLSRLRQVSLNITGKYPDTASIDLNHWRQKLRNVSSAGPVGFSHHGKGAEATLRRPSGARQRSERRNTCLFCDRASSTATKERTTPCLVLENDDTGRADHLVVSIANADHEHIITHTEPMEPIRHRKIDLKRVEDSVSRHASRAGKPGDQAPSAYSRRASSTKISAMPESSNTELFHPQPIASIDHSCTWRTRYIDLSSEMDRIRAELKSSSGKGTGPQSDHRCREVGIEGLTIVMHMRGKDDLVINTDLTREGSLCEHS